MTHTIEDLGPLRKAATITIPASTLAGYENDLTKELGTDVRLPGFRPGKAPLALLKRQYGKYVAAELPQRALQKALEYLKKEVTREIHSLVEVEGAEALTTDSDGTLKITFDFVPEFELPEYKGLDLPLEVGKVEDAEVEDALKTLRSSHAKFEVVDRAAETGDYVKLSYTGTIDGTPVKELEPKAYLYGTQTSTWEEAGSDNETGIPEIVKGIIGKKAGDKATFTHAFSEKEDECPFESLRGKTASYEVEIFEVRSKVLPEFNEEFFKQAGAADLEDLKGQLSAKITVRKGHEAQTAQADKAVKQLLAMVPDFDLPQSEVKKQADQISIRALVESNELTSFDGESVSKAIEAKFEQSRPEAEKAVKRSFILQAIAKKEDLKATDTDLSQHLYYAAYRAGMRTNKDITDFMKKEVETPGRRAAHHLVILEGKALNFVLEHAKGATAAAATETAETASAS